MHRRLFVISLLLSPMLVQPVPALSASSGRMVYQVQHARYGNIGTYSNVIRVLVPLVITDEQLNEALDVLESALESVSTKHPLIEEAVSK